MKRTILSLAAFVFLVSAGASQAASSTAQTTSPAKPMSAQNSRMKDCAAQYHAKGIAKSQYKTFMSGCLKNPSSATTTAPTSSVMSPAPVKKVTPTASPAPAANAPSTMAPPAR